MQIMNSGATMAALGELRKNDTTLGKELRKVASGMKVNGAGDGASEYAMSERMRVRLRSLDQDIENAQTDRSLVNVASGAIQDIVDNLRSMKAMAIDAANDHNTDADRATMEKEFDQRKEQIDDIAATTNYNGKLLLDGRYYLPIAAKESEAASAISGTTIEDFTYSFTKYIQRTVAMDNLPVTGTTTETRPTGLAQYTIAKNGDITVTSDGILVVPPKPTNTSRGLRVITIDADNVELTTNGTTVEDTMIRCSRPNHKLWLNNYSEKSTTGGFYGYIDDSTNGKILLLGHNEFLNHTQANALLFRSGPVTIENGSATNEGTLYIEAAKVGRPAPWIPQFAQGYAAGMSGNVVINSGSIGIFSAYGACIGTECDGTSSGDIEINGGHIIAGSYTGAAAIGAGSHTRGAHNTVTAGNITIGPDAAIDTFAVGGASIGTGAYDLPSLNYTENGTTFTGPSYSVVGDITTTTSKIRAISVYAEAIGSGTGEGGSSLSSADKYGMHRFPYEEFNATHGTITATGGTYQQAFQDQSGTTRYHAYVGPDFSEDVFAMYGLNRGKDGNPLIIHTGTKSNQHLRLYIDDMHTKAMGLDSATIVTREDAHAALDVLDNAVNYALNENTRMGAYAQRLDYTVRNLTTSRENTQSSESTIRDADMAKEMTAYTKANVLAQSAQAMLAQANQNASSVLSLLQ